MPTLPKKSTRQEEVIGAFEAEVDEKGYPVIGSFDINETDMPQPYQERTSELRASKPQTTWDKARDLIDIRSPLWWDNINRFFESDETRAAKLAIALTDAKAIEEKTGVPVHPADALRYQDAISRGIELNPYAMALPSTYRQRVKQSWSIGKKQNMAGTLAGNYLLYGTPKDLEDALAITFPTEEETYLSESRLEAAFRSTAKMLPMMIDTASDAGWKGAITGGAFGLITILAGQPEATLPATYAGFQIGGAYGIWEATMRKEGGLALVSMLKYKDPVTGEKIDRNIAEAAALPIGLISGALEVTQMKTLLSTVPGLRKLLSESIEAAVLSKTVKQKLLQVGKDYMKAPGENTAQEVFQEANSILWEEVAKEANNRLKGTGIAHAQAGEIIGRLKETVIEAGQGFAVLSAPGSIVHAGIAVNKGRIQAQKVAAMKSLNADTRSGSSITGSATAGSGEGTFIPTPTVDAFIETAEEHFPYAAPEYRSVMRGLIEAYARSEGMDPDDYVNTYLAGIAVGRSEAKGLFYQTSKTFADIEGTVKQRAFIEAFLDEPSVESNKAAYIFKTADQRNALVQRTLEFLDLYAKHDYSNPLTGKFGHKVFFAPPIQAVERLGQERAYVEYALHALTSQKNKEDFNTRYFDNQKVEDLPTIGQVIREADGYRVEGDKLFYFKKVREGNKPYSVVLLELTQIGDKHIVEGFRFKSHMPGKKESFIERFGLSQNSLLQESRSGDQAGTATAEVNNSIPNPDTQKLSPELPHLKSIRK